MRYPLHAGTLFDLRHQRIGSGWVKLVLACVIIRFAPRKSARSGEQRIHRLQQTKQHECRPKRKQSEHGPQFLSKQAARSNRNISWLNAPPVTKGALVQVAVRLA